MASKRVQMAQDGFQVRPRWSKMASKTTQEDPRCPKTAGLFERLPTRPTRPPRGVPGRPEEAKNH
eukprot:8428950-Pyramimonas_sp.AAC.1